MNKKKTYIQAVNSKKAAKKRFEEYQKHSQSDSNEIIAELLHINQMMKNSYQQFDQQQFCYVISSKWYKEWKQYTGYDNLKKQQDPQKSKYFGKRRPTKINKDIIVDSDKYFKIPQQLTQYSFLNVILHDDLQQNKDYIITDRKVWDYLITKYEGIQIKRPIFHQKKGPYFDIDLHSFYIGILNDQQILNIQEMKQTQITKQFNQLLTVKKIQVPAIWTFSDLKKFIKKYIQIKYQIIEEAQQDIQITIWKIENFITLENFQLQTLSSIQRQQNQILGRILYEQDYDDLYLDQFTKPTYILFIEFGAITFKLKQLPEIIQGHCQKCFSNQKLDLKCSSCSWVFYCSDKCKYDDKKFHSNICFTCYQSDDDNQYIENQTIEQIKLKTKCGLINLGNTCYMNASLQCLTNINSFVEYFNSNGYINKINPEQIKQNNGIFIKKFAKFTKKMQRYQILPPWSLKAQINCHITIFKGYSQHDANDFIINLLNTLAQFTIKDNPNDPFPKFIMDTFLGSFKSHVICPQCTYESTIIQPFLEVSIPVKTKFKQKEINYIFIKSWNSFQKGSFILKNTWEQIFKDLGYDTNFKKMIFSEGSNLIDIKKQSPQQIFKKYKKDSLIIYPLSNQTNELEISITLAYTKLLSGIEAKCSYGYPILIRVNKNSEIYTIYIQIMKKLGFQEQKIRQFEDFIIKQKNKLQILQNINLDNLNNQQKSKMVQENQNQILKLQNEFPQKCQKMLNKLQLRLNIISTKTSKTNCTFCNQKCNNCPFPLTIQTKFTNLLKLTELNVLKLQLIYNNNQLQIKQKKIKTIDNPYTTLEECIQEFSKPQKLDENNPWYCPRCNSMRLALKELRIQNYPKILVLHLKRFRDENGKKIKNNEIIYYPEILILKNIKYLLNSLIIHEGSLENGHYWAISKKQQLYYSFNDQLINEQSTYFNKNAYILFYEKI